MKSEFMSSCFYYYMPKTIKESKHLPFEYHCFWTPLLCPALFHLKECEFTSDTFHSSSVSVLSLFELGFGQRYELEPPNHWANALVTTAWHMLRFCPWLQFLHTCWMCFSLHAILLSEQFSLQKHFQSLLYTMRGIQVNQNNTKKKDLDH